VLAADAIVAFVRDNTVAVEGLGDVCSLATFDLARHGNPRYGSPVACPKVLNRLNCNVFVCMLMCVFTRTCPRHTAGPLLCDHQTPWTAGLVKFCRPSRVSGGAAALGGS
jgi:Autophagy protein ATG9